MRRTGRRVSVWPIAAAIFIIGLSVIPVCLLGVESIAREWYWPAVFPRGLTARNWSYVFSSGFGLLPVLRKSLWIALCVTVLALLISVPAARALALHRMRGKRILVFLLLLPVLAPPLASTMGIQSLFLRLGLVDSNWGVILAHLIPAVPYSILMLMASFSHFDKDWEAQARTLGAARLSVWRHVTVPSIAPGLAVAAAFAFLISWSQYLTTLFIGGGRVITLPMLLLGFQNGADEGLTATLSLVFLAPTLVVFAFVARFLKPYE